MEKNEAMKWGMLISFALVIIGGINWLLVGVLQVDLIAVIFGGSDSVGSRIIYTLAGLGAVALLTMVILKSNTKKGKKSESKSEGSKTSSSTAKSEG